MDELPEDVRLALHNAQGVLQDWDADSPRRAELVRRILDDVEELLGEES